MTATLHESLRELADEATPSTDPTAARELWRRGRRYRRLRTGGTAAIGAVTLVMLLVVAGVSWQRSGQVEPAPAGTSPGLPDRVYWPDKWLPSVGTEPPGEFAVLLSTVERGTWFGGRTYGVVGISATTGEYRFLDLSDGVLDTAFGEVALSPSGRRVAYWLAGTPSGEPNTNNETGKSITGVAVYDAVTGETMRHEVPTEHGLASFQLEWADDDPTLR